MRATIIGIDCATRPEKVGLARGAVDDDRLRILEATTGSRGRLVAEQVARWITKTPPTLLALDAPLGWPKDLGIALVQHDAGAPLIPQPDALFHRGTDQFVARTTGKRPLEVGADRIARTAHAALVLLEELRRIVGEAIPIAWSTKLDRLAAIEVYPAATLTGRGLPSSGYKRPDQRAQREEILDALVGLMDLPEDSSVLIENADALDSAVCALAGWDFLSDTAQPPPDLERARKEGWIWVRADG